MHRIIFARWFSCRYPGLFSRRAAHHLLMFFAMLIALHADAAPDIPTQLVISSDFTLAREALVEAIEGEGLVVSTVIPFGDMLQRTGSALDKTASPFARLEIVQFCSARLAWLLVEEDVTQAALCPLSITVFSTVAEPGKVVFGYRSPGSLTPGRKQGEALLMKIVSRAVEITRFQRKD